VTPYLTACGGILVVDRLLKWLAWSLLTPGRPVVIAPFLFLNLTFNTGAAFGLLSQGRWVLVFLGLAISVASFVAARRVPSRERGLLAGLGLVGGGAAGNFIDRLIYGHVVDFVDLRVWPVFNLADSAIVIGGLYLAWRSLVWRPPGKH
jgi:signal peptidase II